MPYDVLMIDDEVSLARNIKDYLEVDGLEARVCSDGETGIAAFAARAHRRRRARPTLPGIDGLAVLERLRGMDAGRQGHHRHRVWQRRHRRGRARRGCVRLSCPSRWR